MTYIPQTVSLGGGSGGWQFGYEIDFTAQGTQAVSADGAFSIAGKSWTVSSFANSRTFGLLNGTGLRIYPNATTSDYQNPSANSAPRISIPVSTLIPGFSYPTNAIRVWTQSAFSGVDTNFERCFTALEKGGATQDFRVIQFAASNVGASAFVNSSAVLVNNSITSVFPTFVGSSTLGPATDDVIVLTLAQTYINMRSGVYSGGWPTTLNQDLMSGPFGTATQFSNTNPLSLTLGSNNNGGGGNLTYDIKRIKIEYML